MKKETKLHTFVVLAYKESQYLETCIKSVLNQKYPSEVVIATSTPNDFIRSLASKYKLEIIVNDGKKGIGNDFDFAIKCGKTKLVTVSHQDDIYEYDYSYHIVEEYKKYNDAIILFSDYFELRNGNKVFKNLNLNIKRLLLIPLKSGKLNRFKLNKRASIALGCSICCPAVTFNIDRIKFPVFASDFKCDVDWNAWERLSKLEGRFIFVNKPLMQHRIHVESTTTEIIKDNIRTKEDLEMLKRFWITPVAKIICKIYSNSEKSNNV